MITMAYGAWNIPTYVKFTVNKYMNGSCVKYPEYNETDLLLFCRNSQESNGRPSCCYEQLDKLSPIEHTQFDTCYNVTTGNETSYFKYDCNNQNLHEINLLQIFGVIGAIAIVVLFILFCVGMVNICCRSMNQKSYNRV